LSIKEEIFVIIEFPSGVYLLTSASIVAHPWIGVDIIYLWNAFILLLRSEAFLTDFFCINEALLTGFRCI